jgi:CGNR zinc finger
MHVKTSASPYAYECREDTVRRLPAMPLELVFFSRRVQIAVERTGGESGFHVEYAPVSANAGRGIWLDAYGLREGFLRVKTEMEALAFMLDAGGFQISEDEDDEDLSWSDFKHWQTVIRSILIDPRLPDDIMDPDGSDNVHYIQSTTSHEEIQRLIRAIDEGHKVYSYPFAFSIGPDGEERGLMPRRPLAAAYESRSVLDAILATTYIDGLREIQYRLCALIDCSNLFELTSKHKRQYCSQDCAHKASVRKQRQEARSKKSKLKSKAVSSKPKKAEV